MLKIGVFGDIILDEYWHGDTDRICPEAPVPVLHLKDKEFILGGAANVAANVRSLCKHVSLLGFIGKDFSGEKIKELLKNKDIENQLVLTTLPTVTKIRAMSNWHQLLRVDIEEKKYNKNEYSEIMKSYSKNIRELDVLVISDYNKGTLHNIKDIIKKAKDNNVKVIVDPKGKDFSKYEGCTVITPNLKEFILATNSEKNEENLIESAKKLQEKYSIENVLITMGADGMLLITPKEKHKISAIKRKVYDVTGAGDTVISVLASKINEGVLNAAKFANYAAGIAVGKSGTATLTKYELDGYFSDEITRKIIYKSDELKKIIQGKNIVFTNGCFDIIHPGHVQYLTEAKRLGEVLVVAVNVDETVKKLKGIGRPVNTLEERLHVLAAMQSVDFVIPFDEDTPENLIKELNPNTLVKGGDYNDIYTIPGAHHVLKNNGKVKLLSFIKDVSTTNIIKKINHASD